MSIEAPLDASAIRWRMARRELALWASAFGWPALRVLVLGTALGIALVLGFSELAESLLGQNASTTDVVWLGVRYGLLITIVPSIWAGLSSLALRLARGWAVIPALTLPVYVLIACWLREDELRSSFAALSQSVSAQLDSHGLQMAEQIGLQSNGSMPGTEVPMLMANAGEELFAPSVRAALAVLDHQITLTLLASLVPGVLVSIVALSVGYRRGWRERHEADLERLRKLDAAPS